MTSPLALSGAACVELVRFGEEAQPLLRVDHALADPQLVRTIAAQHRYQPIGPHYPGLRAPVSPAVAMPLAAPLEAVLQESFALSRPPRFRECFLSLVTAVPAQLKPIQRLPHFDGTGHERLAVLLYLDPFAHGGTAFFRQLATGFESVDEARLQTYEDELHRGVVAHGLPPASYIGDGAPLFARTHAEKDRLGRMIIYRGNTLHCADLPAGFAPSADPGRGRLTLNLFLD